MQDTDLSASPESLVSKVVKGQYGRLEIITLTRRFNARCVDLANFMQNKKDLIDMMVPNLPGPERVHVLHILSKRKYWRGK